MSVRAICLGVCTAFLLAVGIVACAKGGTATGDDDPIADAPGTPIDAPNATGDATPRDAAVADAFVPPDAPPDAPSALICSSNAECTNAGECCIRPGTPVGFCGAGIPIGSQCLPQ